MADCAGITQKGAPCQNQAKRGERFCASHLGLAHRPTKLSEEVQQRAVALLRQGNYIETAARIAGISPATYHGWRERGEADLHAGMRTEFSEFFEATTRARAEGEATLLQQIRLAAQGADGRPGDWRAAAWILERTAPDRFGARQELKHSGDGLRLAGPPELPQDEDRLREVASILIDIGVLDALDGGLDD